ncbi:MAG: YeeE/YedE family protein [Rhodospirillales bacterium]|nr:YeeE/YedE family protein [Rhodospirillales bacterium]
MEEMPITTVVGFAGFIAGIVFGATANKTNFCTMGALSDIVFMEDYSRFRAWLLAMAVAIIGSQALHMAGLINLYESIYQTTNLGWLGAIIGGLMFGFGMTMAGGCANKNLVRIGGGNLKSIIVVIVMGIFGYMTLRGLVGLARVELEAFSNIDLSEMGLASQGMIDILAMVIGGETENLRLGFTALFAGGLLVFCFKDAGFRSQPLNIFGGLIVGAMVPLGWWITGVLGADEFDPVPLFSFTFVSPAGESIQYLMTFTGATINFGIATVGGIIVGSFLMAMMSNSFHIEAFTDTADMKRHLFGAAIMGIGGILALGCTVGQGITGMSTLALGSLIALISIIVGGLIGLKYMEEGSLGGVLKALTTSE